MHVPLSDRQAFGSVSLDGLGVTHWLVVARYLLPRLMSRADLLRLQILWPQARVMSPSRPGSAAMPFATHASERIQNWLAQPAAEC